MGEESDRTPPQQEVIVKKFILVWALCMIPSWLWAANLTLIWQPVTGATGYTLYQSVDGGTTWTKGATVTTTTTNVTAVDDKLILFRVSASNASGESISFTKGAWYNGAWGVSPTGLGLQ
jgi:hypothetical protein